MNHYAQALAELQVLPDHELKQIGDQWQTPKALAWGLFHQFAPTLGPVVLDMFADDCNHLVPNYYDAEDNALTQELATDLRRLGGAAYANPPYSRPCTDSEGNTITGMEAILNYCREQRALGAKIMLLIKAATSETWWPEDADFIQFISGRIGFEVPSWYVPRDPKKDKPSSSGFASAVVIFDAGWQGERRPEARLRRDDLITTGTIILDMIHRQAVELTLAADHVIRSAAPKLSPVVTQEQPAKTEPAAGEPPAADDNEASAAVAAELGYADASSIMAKQFECADLGEEQQDTVRGYVQGWLDEPYPLSEIFYRLDLAVANLLAGKPIYQGFALEDNRAPTLPHWQRHPAVKDIIYQIDDADILTPAKTAELAAWIIDNLTAPGDLLVLATTKAAELLAQSAEATSPEPNHAERQLELLDAHHATEEPSTKPLEDWAFDYQNNELNLGGAVWHRFVTVLTVLYGKRELYTAREVAIAISLSDAQLRDQFTTMPDDERERLERILNAMDTMEWNYKGAQRPLNDPQRQAAAVAIFTALKETANTPKHELLERAIAAIDNLKEEVV
ncbi:phage N-6-adenine-methyltransferase [Aeromonas rivipollensis]|uniref:phage N-6-adenine-methyltransferase n=1 Tax=Aeromonas rivipollensis TaxID=948519 RepID=UPI001F093AAA|nr:phage N-6-adenine-methyltransferase [Aeromonas rivipollensis]